MNMLRAAYRQWLRTFLTLGGFSWLWLLCVACGIAVAAVCYTQLKQAVLDPFEFPNANELIAINRVQGMCKSCPVTAGQWRDIDAIAGLDAAGLTGANQKLSAPGLAAQKIEVANTTPNFLSMLQLAPLLGRNLVAEDADGPAIMISEKLWRTVFASDPQVLGKRVNLGSESKEIVGVLSAKLERLSRRDVLSYARYAEDNDGSFFLDIYARQPASMSDAQLQAGLANALAASRQRAPENYKEADYRLEFMDMQLERTTWLRQTLNPILVMVSLLAILMACNAASLFAVSVLKRITALNTEIALGASRQRLLAQVAMQSALFTASGALLALLLAPVLFEFTRRYLLTSEMLSLLSVRYDYTAVLKVALIFMLLNLVASLLPALFILRGKRLISSERTQVSGVGQRIGQIALALQLIGASTVLMLSLLLLRTLDKLDNVDAGFAVAPLWTAKVIFPAEASGEQAQVDAAVAKNQDFAVRAIASVQQIPGVQSAAFANDMPLGEQMWNNGTLIVPGAHSSDPNQEPYAQFRAIVGDYAKTLGIRVLEGRLPEYRPGQEWQEIAVNQEYVDRFMPGVSPVGRTIDQWKVKVVGVLANVKQASLTDSSEPDVYGTLQSLSWMNQSQLIVRAPGVAPETLFAAVREKLAAIDATVPLFAPQSGPELRASVMSTHTLMTRIVTSFALLAIFTTALGLFGLCAYAVARRKREFGLRLALGAAPKALLREFLSTSLKLGLACAVLGTVIGMLQTKLIAKWIFGVQSFDLISLSVSIAAIMLLVVAASFLPAWQASRTDPMLALRSD